MDILPKNLFDNVINGRWFESTSSSITTPPFYTLPANLPPRNNSVP